MENKVLGKSLRVISTGRGMSLQPWLRRVKQGQPRFMGSLVLLIACGMLVALIVSTPVGPPLDQTRTSTSAKPSSAASISLPPIPKLRDRTFQAGITFSHLQGDEHLTGLNEVIGSGACAFDYDNDGWVDLFLVNGSGQTRYYGTQHWWHLPKGNALYRNLGNGRFQVVTKQAGLTKQAWGMGCVTGDLDNDGDPDLLLTNLGLNLLYRNNGDSTFTDITKESGITGERWSTSAGLADYDGDGLLDIYVANYLNYRKGAHTFEAGSQFASDMPPLFDATLYAGQSNQLYHNRGNLRFKDVTAEAGVENASGRSLAAMWLDVNEDQKPDIFVANDKGFPNVLFINQGDGRFQEKGAAYQVNDARGSHSVSAGDIENDGDADLLIGTLAMHPPLMLIQEHRPRKTRSRAFTDRARRMGIGDEASIEFSGWGTGLVDFNNDGWLDLFMVNGLPLPDPDSPRLPQGQTKQLWLNHGHRVFHDVSNQAGVSLRDTFSARGAVFADFDNDGDIDIYVTHNNDIGQLLINEISQNHWLGIKLVGSRGNRDAIGAQVWLQTKEGIQYRVVSSSNGFLSDSDRRLHFGLGQEKEAGTLRILWHDGSENVYKNILADRYIKITQGQPKVTETAISKPREVALKSLGLRVGARRPQHRIQYLRWLLETTGIAGALPELEVAIRDADPKVRQEVISLLTRHKHERGLKLLIAVLDDPQATIRVAAIKALQKYEAEESARWLLRAFGDLDPKVRTAVADGFGFFFREEEAMIHRKYLALPYLIHMLGDADPRARIAAARALGDAERYRGVDPLIELLDDPIAEVRAQAARALGLLRERKAIPPLVSLLQDREQLPTVRAHVLIALKRLNYGKMDQVLSQELGNQGQATDPKTTLISLETLKVIFDDDADGVVINRAQMVRRINTWLAATKYLNGSTTTSNTSELIRPAVDVLALSRSKLAKQSLERFTEHADPEVRAKAYSALIDLDSQRRSTLAVAALRDPSVDVRRTILEVLSDTDITVSVGVLLDSLRHAETRLSTIRVLARYADDRIEHRLLSLARDPQEAVAIRLAALESVTAMKIQKPALPNNLFSDEDHRIRAAALKYWASRLPQHTPGELPTRLSQGLEDSARNVRYATVEILVKRHEAWAASTLKQLLMDENTEIGLRRRTVEALAARGNSRALTSLTRLARLRHDPLSKVALMRLSDLSEAKTDSFMRSLLEDPDEDEDIRFLAAKSLYPRHAKMVLATLTSD